MSFTVFKLLFAAIALALVVVVVLVVRKYRRERHDAVPRSKAQPRAESAEKPGRKKPGLGRKAPKPEPELTPDEPPPPRRRQLHSFAEAERNAAGEIEAEWAAPAAKPALTPMGMTPAEITPEAEPEPEADLAPEPTPAPIPTSFVPPEPDYSQAVMNRLEEAFEALQEGEITLPVYRERLLGEDEAVGHRIAVLQSAGDSEELDAAIAARGSVRWCLDWADEQARAQDD